MDCCRVVSEFLYTLQIYLTYNTNNNHKMLMIQMAPLCNSPSVNLSRNYINVVCRQEFSIYSMLMGKLVFAEFVKCNK